MIIPFGRWSPGLSDTTPGCSAVIDGVIPRADDGYGPMPQLETLSTSTALATAPRGTISFTKADGSFVRFVGITAKIIQIGVDGTQTDIDTGLALPDGDVWSFAVFGTKLLYTNTTDGLIAYDFEAGGAAAAVSGAPAARFIFVVADRVVALDCDGDNRLMQTSAINDHTEWKDGGATYQPFTDGGGLTGGVAVSHGAAIIFQRDAIRLMQFGNVSGQQYSLFRMTRESGARSGRSIVGASGWAYYLSTNGPQRISIGSTQPEPIGAVDGIDRWLSDMVDPADIPKLDGSYDVFRRMVWWRIKVTGDSDNVFSRAIGYHIDYGKWVSLTVSTSAMFTTATASYTYATVPNLAYDASEDLPYDAAFWAGGEPFFAGFDNSYKLAAFSGSSMAVTAESARHLFPTSFYINSVTPETDAANATIAIGVADTPQAGLTWTDDIPLNSEGDAMFLSRGRSIKGRLKIAAGESWTYIKGFRDINESGK